MLARIAHKHASVGITEDQYPVVHQHLFAAILEVLGDAVTPEVVIAWDEVYWHMAGTRHDREAPVRRDRCRRRRRLAHPGPAPASAAVAGHRVLRASKFLQNNLFEGEQIEVSAPFGGLALEDSVGPLVLISAGIGLTPIIGILHYLAGTGSTRDVLVPHVDRSPAGTPIAKN